MLDGLAEAVGLLERRAVGAVVEEDAAPVRRVLGDPVRQGGRPVGVAPAPRGEHRHLEPLDDRPQVEPCLLADEPDGDVERRLQRDGEEPVDVLRLGFEQRFGQELSLAERPVRSTSSM